MAELTRDDKVESWLTARDVTFSPVKSIPLAQIDEKSSLHNQARDVPLIPDAVERYQNRMKAGEKFPPIVLYRRGKNYVVIDGNNRCAAARKVGWRDFPAYVVDDDTPSETIELLIVGANSRHGVATPTQWRKQQAVYLVVGRQLPIELVAEETGLHESTISMEIRAQKANVRASELKVKGFDDVSSTVKSQLNSIQSDPVFAACSQLIVDTQWGHGPTLGQFLKDVRKRGSEAEQLTFVAEVAEQRRLERNRVRSGASRRIASPKNQVLSALGAILAVDTRTIPRLFLTDVEREEVERRCIAAAERLLEMQTAIQRAREGRM